jgi:uncharacterized Zn finger protein
MSDKTLDKAKRYLAEGKVTVLALGANAAMVAVQGSASQPYTADFGGTHWKCDCPAFTYHEECPHVEAAKLIIPFRDKVRRTIGTPDSSVADYLNSFLNK